MAVDAFKEKVESRKAKERGDEGMVDLAFKKFQNTRKKSMVDPKALDDR